MDRSHRQRRRPNADRGRLRRALGLVIGIAASALHAAEPTSPPSADVAAFYTRPLVRARLRIPDSLQGFAVTSIQPAADDPTRFEIEVQFQARTPFGGYTAHQAGFQMKWSASEDSWMVTAR